MHFLEQILAGFKARSLNYWTLPGEINGISSPFRDSSHAIILTWAEISLISLKQITLPYSASNLEDQQCSITEISPIKYIYVLTLV